MRLTQLRDFLAVVETGSVRAAARKLGLTQPALSKSLRRLEAEMGAVLVTRSVRGAVLTDLGRAFHARARSIDGDLRKAREEIAQLRGRKEGTLSVGASPAPAMGLVPAAIAEVRERWRAAHIRVIDILYPAVLGALREGEIDVAIGPRIGQRHEDDAGFVIERLFYNEVVIAVRKGHPLQRAQRLRDLARCEWLRSGPKGGPATVVDDAFREAGLEPPECQVQCESFLALPEIVARSDVVAIVPWQMLELPGAGDRLVRVPIREKLLRTEISLFTRAGVPPTPIASEFIGAVRRLARKVKSRTAS